MIMAPSAHDQHVQYHAKYIINNLDPWINYNVSHLYFIKSDQSMMMEKGLLINIRSDFVDQKFNKINVVNVISVHVSVIWLLARENMQLSI